MHKVLIVDDDPDLLELLRLSFEAAGFSVAMAANGPDALKQAQELPDLIILDLVLPDLDGFNVCQTLKKKRTTASIPVIILTGLSSEFNRFAGLECGADDYVTKPVTPEELLARIRPLLDRRAASRRGPLTPTLSPSAPSEGARGEHSPD